MSIQAYDIQLGAAGSNTSTQIIEATAQICDFLNSGSAFDTIEVRPDFTAGSAVLKLGQGFDFGKPVNRWLVVNKGATPVNGTLMLSTAGFRNFRISGDVNVLDGSKSRALNGSAFSLVGAAGGLAGNYGQVQLWNPAGSNTRLVVEAVAINDNVENNIAFFTDSTAALATLVGSGKPKMIGSAVASQGKVYVGNVAAPPPATSRMGVLSMLQWVTYQQKFAEPVVIPPGYGLVVCNAVTGSGIGVAYEWYEEPNT
jgi:hypothetical protein